MCKTFLFGKVFGTGTRGLINRFEMRLFLSHVILTTPRRAELSQSGNGEGGLKWSAELEIKRRATDNVGSRCTVLSEMMVCGNSV